MPWRGAAGSVASWRAAPPSPVAPSAPASAARRSWLRRAAVFGVPGGYLVALTVVTVSWGLPVARDQLFIWLVAGLAAFSVPAWRGWGGCCSSGCPSSRLLAAYDYLRGAVSVTAGQAHVIPQIDFDKALFARPRAHASGSSSACGTPATCTGTTTRSGAST